MRKPKKVTSAKPTRGVVQRVGPRSSRPGKAMGLAPRSPKAGSPPVDVKGSPRVRRRQKSANVKLSKGTTVFGTDHGPRAAWPASVAKRKKR
jgi:hypothetical protein